MVRRTSRRGGETLRLDLLEPRERRLADHGRDPIRGSGRAGLRTAGRVGHDRGLPSQWAGLRGPERRPRVPVHGGHLAHGGLRDTGRSGPALGTALRGRGTGTLWLVEIPGWPVVADRPGGTGPDGGG